LADIVKQNITVIVITS